MDEDRDEQEEGREMSEMTDASIAFDSQLNMCEKRLCACGDEWEPGEYVVKVLPGVGAEPLELTHERVIRCRDCEHFVDVMGQTECERSSGEYFGVGHDGFCAWAEPKEES